MWQPWRSDLSSRELLEQAHAALAEGDTLGASEKGWMAVAQALYALADERGWEGRRFRVVPQALAYLADEPNGRELQELFLGAYALHMNFYENFLPEETVEVALEQVQKFIEKLKLL